MGRVSEVGGVVGIVDPASATSSHEARPVHRLWYGFTARLEATLRRSGRRNQRPQYDDEPRVNERIQVPRVLLVDEEGQRLGEFLTRDALQLAKDRQLDLVEVAPNAKPPVCRITDYGKLRYDRQKRDAAARKKQHQVQLKELKVRPKTDDHDMNVKIKRAMQFLKEGNKVKITVWFRGREHAHHEIGAEQCMRVAQAVEGYGKVEKPPSMDGRNMVMILAPVQTQQTADSDDASEAADAR